MSALRVGLVGAGWWATEHHLPALLAHPNAVVTAVADRDAERAADVAAQFGIAHHFGDADELVASGESDALVVSTSHPGHHPVARAALLADLHVLVEKPLALRARDAWELVDLARDRRRHLMVGCTYQFTSTAQELHRQVSSGLLGDLISVSAVFTSSVDDLYRGRWFPGMDNGPKTETYADPANHGGQANSQASHPLGMIFRITGATPARAHAFMTNGAVDVDVADALSIQFDNGAVGSLGTDGSLRPGQLDRQLISYVGSAAVAVQDLGRGLVSITTHEGAETTLELLADESPYPADRPAAAFVDLIRGHGPNPAPGEAAAWTAAVLDACYRSAAEGTVLDVEGPRAG
jgi:predicted dehydrogenase